MAKYICKLSIEIKNTDSGKQYSFIKGKYYDFIEEKGDFVFIDDKKPYFNSDFMECYFVKVSDVENKSENEDSHNGLNTFKESNRKTWLKEQEEEHDRKFSIPPMLLSEKLQEIHDNFEKESSHQNFQLYLELDFDMEVQSTLQKIQQLLLVKGVEYRRNSDPFHNFNVGSQISGEIPEKVLQGFLLKHLVSYQDMLNDIEQGKLPKIETVEEKFGDILVYFVIQKCQFINRIKKS